jgi:hypothetical protein
MVTRKNRKEIHNLNSQVLFLNISWAIHGRELYINVIEEINDLYKKMLMIGKCNEVFQLCNDKIPDLLSAPTKKEYILAKKTYSYGIADIRFLEHPC